MIIQPFSPAYGSGIVVTPAAASANSNIGRGSKNLRFVNLGANVCYVRAGEGAQTASTADTPIAAGQSLIVTKSERHDNVGYISATGTTLHIQPGEGIS